MTTHVLQGRTVFFWFVLFFLAIIAVNVGMAIVAVHTNRGVVREHAYEEGLHYNRIIAAEEAQATLGWKAGISLNYNEVRVTLRDASDSPLVVERVEVTIRRPLEASLQQHIVLRPYEVGGYHAPVTLPKKGVWELQLFATRGKTSFQQTTRVVVP